MNKYYQRNIIKEKLQDSILNFVYNDSKYKNLIFTGGTCLRKLYSLPRLSEDLDFDYTSHFDIANFEAEIKNHLIKIEKFSNVELKIANNQKTIFIKFTQENKEKIFVRCDFSKAGSNIKTELTPYSSDRYNFFILNYDLPTLFGNKIKAFLDRKFFKGSEQTMSFKGRDVFDIAWFIQLSAKSGFVLKPEWKNLEKDLNMSKKEIIDAVIEKVSKINNEELLLDLVPFIESEQDINNFLMSYVGIIKNKFIYIA
jgi:predicted nucleotidyltransferase component of viral defense system